MMLIDPFHKVNVGKVKKHNVLSDLYSTQLTTESYTLATEIYAYSINVVNADIGSQ